MSSPTTPPPAGDQAARLLRLAGKAAEVVSATLFAALFLTFVAQVFWRYALRDPLVWTLEAAGILFVTLSLFTAATQMPFREHVALELFLDIFPRKVRRVLVTLSLSLFALAMLVSLPDTFGVLKWMYREHTYAIDFNLGHLFVLMIVFVIAYILRAVAGIIQLWRQSWDEET